MAQEYFNGYHSYLDSMEELGDAERGRLFTACLLYSKSGELLELRGNERFVFPAMRSQIDRDKAAYAKKCNKQRENAEKRWNKSDATACHGMPPYANDAKDKEKDKDKDIYNDYDRAREGYIDQGMKRISDLYQSNIGMITPVISTGLREYRETLSDDVICKAIETAAANQARSWTYIRAILTDKESKGIDTLEKWEAAETERKHSGKKRGKSIDDILDEME